MGINFDKAPKGEIGGYPPEGVHLMYVDKATVKIGKTSNAPYLELKFIAIDANGQNIGTFQDVLTNSDHEINAKKAQRLMHAVGADMTGEVQLKDIGKVVVKKKFYGEVIHAEEEYNGKTITKAKPRVFGSQIFWTIQEREGGAESDFPFVEEVADLTDVDKALGITQPAQEEVKSVQKL